MTARVPSRGWRRTVAALLLAPHLLGVGLLGVGAAQAGPLPVMVESDIDPAVFEIPQARFLGVRPDPGLALIDQDGRRLGFAEALAGTAGGAEGGEALPLVLVLSYYQCDGTCSAINAQFLDLARRLADPGTGGGGLGSPLLPGRDYRVLTLSFDGRDTPATLAAFRDGMRLPDSWPADAWRWALFADPQAITPFTDGLGYKFFWSPMDRTFFHPGVYVVFTPEGRVSRYLYAFAAGPGDLRLALTEARGERIGLTPRELINYASLLCYSYNYAEGRYALNIPMFVGFGSLALGVAMFAGAALSVRRRMQKLREARV